MTGLGDNDEGYVVSHVGNEYDAALKLIGRWGDKIQLTNEQMAKLSNESSGGAFYSLASGFRAIGSNGNDSSYYPSWFGDATPTYGNGTVSGLNLYQTLYVNSHGGYGYVWAVETNQSAIASALEDYTVIYNGGNLGGGNNGGVSGELTKAETGSTSLTVYSDSQYDSERNTITSHGAQSTVSFPSLPNSIRYMYSSNSFFKRQIDSIYNQYGGPIFVRLRLGDRQVLIASLNGVDAEVQNGNLVTSSRVMYYRHTISSLTLYNVIGLGYLCLDNQTSASAFSDSDSTFYLNNTYYTLDFFAGDGVGGNLTNNWPEDNGGGSDTIYGTGGSDVPDPEAPEVELPTYEDPVIDPPDDPTPPNEHVFQIDPLPTPVMPTMPTGTTSADYMPWLEAILRELYSIHVDLASYFNALQSDIDSHCRHITSTITNMTVWLWNCVSPRLNYMLSTILERMHVESVWLEDMLEYDMWAVDAHLEAYLHDLFEGLANNLDAVAYDDHDLMLLLLLMYDELAGIGGDPVDYTFLLTTIDGHVVDVLDAIDSLAIPSPSDYSSLLSTIDGHVVDVLNAVEGISIPSPVDYSSYLDEFETDLQLVLDNWDMFFSDLGNVQALLSEISGKLDRLGAREPRHWDFPEPELDPETGTWIVPVGTQEIEPGGHLVTVYRPVNEVIRIDALRAAVEELCRHFPFVMLNKLVQVAVWLTRTGIPPQFDLPVPNPADWSSPGVIRVDLRPFDPVAAVSRMGILLWSIVRVSSRTIDMWVKEER